MMIAYDILHVDITNPTHILKSCHHHHIRVDRMIKYHRGEFLKKQKKFDYK